MKSKNAITIDDLIKAIKANDKGRVEQYIKESPSLVNLTSLDGDTPLGAAIITKNQEIGQLLLDNGTDPNLLIDIDVAPLGLAIDYNNKFMTDLLIKKGSKIIPSNLCDIKNTETFQLALDRGVNINEQDNDGNTPIMLNMELDIVELLIKKGADINHVNNNGMSVLGMAVLSGKNQKAELLVRNNANIDHVDNNGDNVLYYALITEQDDIFKFLIENRININQINNEGKNVLYYAARQVKNDAVKLLIENGADLSILYSVGESILSFYPPDSNNPEMFEFLMKHGADYSLLPKVTEENQLQQMANNNQSAHNAKIITQVYPKFMTDETKNKLEQGKQQYNKQFGELLSSTLLPEQGSMSPEFQKLFLKLVKDKIQDCKDNIGQGDKFIDELLIASNSGIKFDDIKHKKITPENEKELMDNVSSFIASNSEASKKYLKDLSKKVTNLTADLNGNHQVGNITIDQSLVIPLILSKVQDTAELPRLIIEAIDAATMYASGGVSCKDGQLNKLSELLVGIDDQQIINKQAIRGEFPFKGFRVNHNALVEEIFTIAGDKGKGLNEIDAQKVRSAIYQIMKESNLESTRFSEIFSYGSEINILAEENKMKEFKEQMNYEIISKIQQDVLGAKSEAVYNIPDQYLPVEKNKNLEKHIIPKLGQTSLLKQNIQRKLYDLGGQYGEFFKKNREQLNDEDLNGLDKLEGGDLAKGVVELLLSKNVNCAAELGVEKELKAHIGNNMTVNNEEMVKFIVEASIEKPAMQELPSMDKTALGVEKEKITGYCEKGIVVTNEDKAEFIVKPAIKQSAMQELPSMDKIKEVFKSNKEKRSNSNDPRIKPRMVEDILNPPKRKASENNLYRGKLGLTR